MVTGYVNTRTGSRQRAPECRISEGKMVPTNSSHIAEPWTHLHPAQRTSVIVVGAHDLLNTRRLKSAFQGAPASVGWRLDASKYLRNRTRFGGTFAVQRACLLGIIFRKDRIRRYHGDLMRTALKMADLDEPGIPFDICDEQQCLRFLELPQALLEAITSCNPPK